MEEVVATGVTICAKLQSNRRHQQTPSCLQAGCPSCRPTNSVKALKGESVTLHGLAHLGFSNLVS